MTTKPDRAQYQAWAARARDLAARATTDTARTLHIAIAKEYEAKAAAAAAPAQGGATGETLD
jgi:hypothetical protein